jgi:plasmid stabilization system protein ParE
VKHYQVIILPSAERDIGDAYEWLAEGDEEAAARWYNRLTELILALDTFPERAPLAPENKYFNQEIREIFHGRRQHKFRILFTVTEGLVYVLHVRHGARPALGETGAADD